MMFGGRSATLLVLTASAVLLGACGIQFESAGRRQGSDREYADLRVIVVEQREALEDLKKEQEQLRAAIEELQYKEHTREAVAAAVAPEPGYWWAGGRQPTPEVPQPVADPALDAYADDEPYPVEVSGQAPGLVPEPRTAAAPAARDPLARPVTLEGELPRIPDALTGTAYDRGVRALVRRDYEGSIQGFHDFIHENASSAYTDDAQYWIGEAYFRRGQYHRAIIEFNQVAISYGSGDRAAAALLRQAEAFRIVGDRVDARLSLQKVINRYPDTPEATRASRILVELGG